MAGALGAALVMAGGLLAAPAEATGATGKCASAKGVSVAVDYYDLGPANTTRCAPPLSGQTTFSGTALQALTGAGYTVTGTQRWGTAFICRVNGYPTATQHISIPGNSTYQEKCVDTPPAAAYWALWTASNGGTWKLATSGAATQKLTGGQWEGWAFEHNRSTAVPPRFTPTR